MKLKVRRINIETGFTPVVTINHKNALLYDLHAHDRVLVETTTKKRKRCIAVVDLINTDNTIKEGTIGILTETNNMLEVKNGSIVDVHPAEKPEAVTLIRKKMEGGSLSEKEYDCIVKAIVEGTLTEIELTYFVSAIAIRGLDMEEISFLTKSVARNGSRFITKKRPIIDKHCIGGVPGNRTTMIVVPILTAFGLTVPKTSSRAITSPAGTADTMEALANVSLDLTKMKRVVRSTGGCIAWGGTLGLAPADDKIIRIEKPMTIDAPGLMLSSVMAKKFSVGATHVIIDIPYGKGAKVQTKKRGEELKRHFLMLGKLLGMKMKVLLTDGRSPIGRGIGPVLEARDVLAVLKNKPNAPQDLRNKSLHLAAEMLEFSGSVRKGAGYEVARDILESGSAWKKMDEIITAQGRVKIPSLGRKSVEISSKCQGRVIEIDNKAISKLARIAGAPVTKGAGLYLYKKVGDTVRKGELLYTVYADSADKLRHVRLYNDKLKPYVIKK